MFGPPGFTDNSGMAGSKEAFWRLPQSLLSHRTLTAMIALECHLQSIQHDTHHIAHLQTKLGHDAACHSGKVVELRHSYHGEDTLALATCTSPHMPFRERDPLSIGPLLNLRKERGGQQKGELVTRRNFLKAGTGDKSCSKQQGWWVEGATPATAWLPHCA